jgi:hypothetical protein
LPNINSNTAEEPILNAAEPTAWDAEILNLLGELSAAQNDLLDLLVDKRKSLAAGDRQRLVPLQVREQALIDRLSACQQRRQRLLDRAASEGLPSDSIQSLAGQVPAENSRALQLSVDDARRRARLLQHQSLTNWVLVQRTLLHLSHVVEIIATGGRMQPTYGKGAPFSAGGILVDQAV